MICAEPFNIIPIYFADCPSAIIVSFFRNGITFQGITENELLVMLECLGARVIPFRKKETIVNRLLMKSARITAGMSEPQTIYQHDLRIFRCNYIYRNRFFHILRQPLYNLCIQLFVHIENRTFYFP